MAASDRTDQLEYRTLSVSRSGWHSGATLRRADQGSAAYERFGGLCAILAGIGGLGYAFAFVVVSQLYPDLGGLLSALLLLVNGLLSAAAMVALFYRVRTTDAAFATLGLALGLAGHVGAVLHGGYDLANAIHPPATPNLDLPSPVDPRGLATFGLVGLAVLVISWLLARTPGAPRGLAHLGYLLSALLVVLYMARLVVLSPTSPLLLVPVLVTGFIANPAWLVWLGITLRRGASGASRHAESEAGSS